MYDADLDGLLEKVWNGGRITPAEALHLYALPLEGAGRAERARRHRHRSVLPGRTALRHPWRPSWLRMDRVLGEMGIPRKSVDGRRELGRLIEARLREGSELLVVTGARLGEREWAALRALGAEFCGLNLCAAWGCLPP